MVRDTLLNAAVLCPTDLQRSIQSFVEDCISALPTHQDLAGFVATDVASTSYQSQKDGGSNVHLLQSGIIDPGHSGIEDKGKAVGWHMSLSRVQPVQRMQRKSLLREVKQAVAAARSSTLWLDTLMVRILILHGSLVCTNISAVLRCTLNMNNLSKRISAASRCAGLLAVTCPPDQIIFAVRPVASSWLYCLA
jgi:hypothetical protein